MGGSDGVCAERRGHAGFWQGRLGCSRETLGESEPANPPRHLGAIGPGRAASAATENPSVHVGPPTRLTKLCLLSDPARTQHPHSGSITPGGHNPTKDMQDATGMTPRSLLRWPRVAAPLAEAHPGGAPDAARRGGRRLGVRAAARGAPHQGDDRLQQHDHLAETGRGIHNPGEQQHLPARQPRGLLQPGTARWHSLVFCRPQRVLAFAAKEARAALTLTITTRVCPR